MEALHMSNHQLSNIDLVKLLPDILQQDNDTKALMQVLSEQMQRLYRLTATYLGDDIPVSLLDFIAYERHVDFYDVNLTEKQKRTLIENAKVSHQTKGTAAAIEAVVTAVYPAAKVIEWYEYGGQPYHFRVNVDAPVGSSTDLNLLNRMVDSVKRKSAVLDSIQFNSILSVESRFAGALTISSLTVIRG
jgi:phage tail P2-like protein